MSGEFVGFVSIGLLMIINILIVGMAWGTEKTISKQHTKDIQENKGNIIENRKSFDSILNALRTVNTHLEKIDGHVDNTSKSITKIETKMEGHEKRISELEKKG